MTLQEIDGRAEIFALDYGATIDHRYDGEYPPHMEYYLDTGGVIKVDKQANTMSMYNHEYDGLPLETRRLDPFKDTP